MANPLAQIAESLPDIGSHRQFRWSTLSTADGPAIGLWFDGAETLPGGHLVGTFLGARRKEFLAIFLAGVK